jgi:hypothetical protein
MSARPDQCWLTSGRWHLNCDSCLIYDCVRTRNHIVRTVEVDLPIYWTWKESEADRSLMDVWRAVERSGRMQAVTEAFRHSVGSGRKRYVVRTDDAGLSGVRSWWTCCPDGWNSGQMGVRTGWHVVRMADKESEIFYLLRSAESSENALSSGIIVYNIFTHKWFCPNTEWGQNTNRRETIGNFIGNKLALVERPKLSR